MRSLVTGASGFIGAALAHALAARGDEVTVLVRGRSKGTLLDGLSARRHVADLTDPDALRGCCDGMDRVFHVAGDVSYRRADRNRQWAANVDGTINLLREAERAGVGRFIHTSSIAAVGVPEGGPVPVDETFPFNGHRFGLQYFISKRAAEEAVLRSAARGLPAVIVNPDTVYGPGDLNSNGGRLLLMVHNRRVF
ncbi:MAG: NAD-dependent epimerase/dehydratase family protein, partial [Chloroflexi bacterium]|nr:NAD-dependent epimerase/dehydratase family protein [Chloroflexota bacterium]